MTVILTYIIDYIEKTQKTARKKKNRHFFWDLIEDKIFPPVVT